LFSEERCSDGQIAPAFEKTWNTALRRRDAIGHASGWRPRLALAAAILIAIGAMVLIVHNINSPKQPTTVTAKTEPDLLVESRTAVAAPSIADWKSPTAFILDQAAEEASPGATLPMRRDGIRFDF
jgi:hypothetical protein